MSFFSSIIGSVVGNGLNPNKWLTSALTNTDGGLGNKFGHIWNDLTGTSEQMKFNANEAQKQRNWETEMSNTAFQRQMTDIKAAGLNPTLMYGAGTSGTTGANTPNGATASAPGNGGNPISALLGVISGLNSIRKTNAEIENISADTDKKEHESGKITQETLYTIENTKQVRANVNYILDQSRLTEAQRQEAMERIDIMLKQEEEIGERIKILQNQGKTSEVQAQFAKAEAIQRQITGYLDTLIKGVGAVKGTSALPINVHSNSSNANYQMPFQLY